MSTDKIKSQIIEAFMKHVAKKGKVPKSIYSFCSKNDFEEDDFYNHFTSYANLQKEIYLTLFNHTIQTLLKDKEYDKFTAENKLLSFYFTFFENMKANRSYVVIDLKSPQDISKLELLKEAFDSYIKSLGLKSIDFKSDIIHKLGRNIKGNVMWLQLMLILKFWLKDDSKGFEKTDILIEKAVSTTMQIMDTTPLESIMDLGKFLFKEKKAFMS